MWEIVRLSNLDQNITKVSYISLTNLYLDAKIHWKSHGMDFLVHCCLKRFSWGIKLKTLNFQKKVPLIISIDTAVDSFLKFACFSFVLTNSKSGVQISSNSDADNVFMSLFLFKLKYLCLLSIHLNSSFNCNVNEDLTSSTSKIFLIWIVE